MVPGPELNRYVSFETRDFKSKSRALTIGEQSIAIRWKRLMVKDFEGIQGRGLVTTSEVGSVPMSIERSPFRSQPLGYP